MPTVAPPRVDVGALAAAIRADVTDRLATVLIAGFESLEENGRGLSQFQRTDLTQWVFDIFDGFERSVAKTLVRDLSEHGVSAWGLGTELEDLLPERGENGA